MDPASPDVGDPIVTEAKAELASIEQRLAAIEAKLGADAPGGVRASNEVGSPPAQGVLGDDPAAFAAPAPQDPTES